MIGRDNGTELPQSVIERVAVVRALVARPRVILFDDAAAAQDREGELRMRELLARRKPDCAILMVTDRPEWLAMADRRLRIVDDLLIDDAPP